MTDLLKVAKGVISSCTSLESDARGGLEVDSAEYVILFKMLNGQLEVLSNITKLVADKSFRSCFIILRSVFESYFLFVLMLKGRFYRITVNYVIEPNQGSSVKDARDRTLQKWNADKQRGDLAYTQVEWIREGKSDAEISVRYKWEGLFESSDVAKKGEVVTQFYFAYVEYEPIVHYLHELGTISLGALDKETEQRQYKEQSKLYHEYLEPKAIVENLRLNDLLVEDQEVRFKVHYNFLSNFTHPTRKGALDRDDYCQKYHLSPKQLDQALTDLILQYTCSILQLYLESTVEYFKERNKKDWHSVYDGGIATLRSNTKDFWFIYNDPTRYDQETSDHRREDAKMLGNPIETPGVLYYADPIKRQVEFRP